MEVKITEKQLANLVKFRFKNMKNDDNNGFVHLMRACEYSAVCDMVAIFGFRVDRATGKMYEVLSKEEPRYIEA